MVRGELKMMLLEQVDTVSLSVSDAWVATYGSKHSSGRDLRADLS